MMCVENENFRLNRILLLVVGLWPYERSLLVRIQFISIFSILMASVVFQITALWTSEYKVDRVIKILSCALPFALPVIEYIAFMINSYTVKYLLERLQHICNELKDENEIAIMRQYGNEATVFTTRLLLLALVSVCFLILLPISPHLLDNILPANESRPRFTMPIVTYYFVDQEKYFHLILLHMIVSLCIGIIVLMATGSIIITYLKHACAMFSIVRYRIQQAMTIDQLKKINIGNKSEICKQIASGVIIHRTAMEFSTTLISDFEGSLLVLMIVCVADLSLNMCLVCQIVLCGSDIKELLIHLIFVASVLIYMFLANYISQDITNNNNDVFVTVYNVQWYKSPVEIQKMILFLLQRKMKSFTLNLGKIVSGSFENMAKLINASLSYFAVLYSTQ